MDRKQEIINKLSEYGKEMSKQDHRSTANPIWCDYIPDGRGKIELGAFSFFETDVLEENNYVASNYEAEKMKDLQKLLIELGKMSVEVDVIDTRPPEYIKGLELESKQQNQYIGYLEVKHKNILDFHKEYSEYLQETKNEDELNYSIKVNKKFFELLNKYFVD